MTSDTTCNTNEPSAAQIQLDIALGNSPVHIAELSNSELLAFLNTELKKAELKHLRGFAPLSATIRKKKMGEVAFALSETLSFQTNDPEISLDTQSLTLPNGSGNLTVTKKAIYKHPFDARETTDQSEAKAWRETYQRGSMYYEKCGEVAVIQLFRTDRKQTANSSLYITTFSFSTAEPAVREIRDRQSERLLQREAALPASVIHSVTTTKLPLSDEFFSILGDNAVRVAIGTVKGVAQMFARTHRELQKQEQEIGKQSLKLQRIVGSIC